MSAFDEVYAASHALMLHNSRHDYQRAIGPAMRRHALRNMTVAAISHDRCVRRLAAETEARRKMVFRRPLDFKLDLYFGALIKNPFAVVRMTGV